MRVKKFSCTNCIQMLWRPEGVRSSVSRATESGKQPDAGAGHGIQVLCKKSKHSSPGPSLQASSSFRRFVFTSICLYIWLCLHTCIQHICSGEGSLTLRSWSSPSTLCSLETKFRLPGFVARILSSWDIWLAPFPVHIQFFCL